MLFVPEYLIDESFGVNNFFPLFCVGKSFRFFCMCDIPKVAVHEVVIHKSRVCVSYLLESSFIVQ